MVSRGLQKLTWACHICHAIRPDEKVSVKITDISADYDLEPGTMRQNVRYCNDNTECMREAMTFKFYQRT